jgi:hypothetical protein
MDEDCIILVLTWSNHFDTFQLSLDNQSEMTMTLHFYSKAGVEMGAYEAITADEGFRSMCRDAGYQDPDCEPVLCGTIDDWDFTVEETK